MKIKMAVIRQDCQCGCKSYLKTTVLTMRCFSAMQCCVRLSKTLKTLIWSHLKNGLDIDNISCGEAKQEHILFQNKQVLVQGIQSCQAFRVYVTF